MAKPAFLPDRLRDTDPGGPGGARLAAFTLSGPLIGAVAPSFPGFFGLRDIDYVMLSALKLIGRVEASVGMALIARAFWRG